MLVIKITIANFCLFANDGACSTTNAFGAMWTKTYGSKNTNIMRYNDHCCKLVYLIANDGAYNTTNAFGARWTKAYGSKEYIASVTQWPLL